MCQLFCVSSICSSSDHLVNPNERCAHVCSFSACSRRPTQRMPVRASNCYLACHDLARAASSCNQDVILDNGVVYYPVNGGAELVCNSGYVFSPPSPLPGFSSGRHELSCETSRGIWGTNSGGTFCAFSDCPYACVFGELSAACCRLRPRPPAAAAHDRQRRSRVLATSSFTNARSHQRTD